MESITQFFTGTAASIANYLLFSLALWLLSGKLKWEKRWMAWVPGLRYRELGRSMGAERDGVVCGALDVLVILARAMDLPTGNERVQVALALAVLVVLLIYFIYRIRLFLRLTTVLGARKTWLLLWILVEWLAILILAVGKKYVPRKIGDTDEWLPGTRPADIPSAPAAGKKKAGESGLSVALRERTVRDLGGKRYLLKDINLEIPNGSLVLLLGGSGSGKTTFVNALIGYEKADAEVTLNGTNIYTDYDRMKYRIGFVPQKNLIRGNDTVVSTVNDAAELRLPKAVSRNERREKVEEVMDLLGLSAGAHGLVSKKSGGQLRRISIAMELITDPELFVLDEPDSGLDGVIAREIFTKLRAVADTGKIVIVITHTPDRVVDLFDKVIVLARDSGRVGRLAFYGSPQEAREFFGKDTMEGVVMSVNRKEEGGDGLADEFIERYARLAAGAEEEAAV